jgi:hypothetical protein
MRVIGRVEAATADLPLLVVLAGGGFRLMVRPAWRALHGPFGADHRLEFRSSRAFARLNGGTFPRAHVESYVTGNEDQPAPAHRSRAMPVWGPIFKGLDSIEIAVKRRIANIVDYIESL